MVSDARGNCWAIVGGTTGRLRKWEMDSHGCLKSFREGQFPVLSFINQSHKRKVKPIFYWACFGQVGAANAIHLALGAFHIMRSSSNVLHFNPWRRLVTESKHVGLLNKTTTSKPETSTRRIWFRTIFHQFDFKKVLPLTSYLNPNVPHFDLNQIEYRYDYLRYLHSSFVIK